MRKCLDVWIPYEYAAYTLEVQTATISLIGWFGKSFAIFYSKVYQHPKGTAIFSEGGWQGCCNEPPKCCTPSKTNMTRERQPSEDVFPIINLFYTLKINMDPENHLFGKENHLPNLQYVDGFTSFTIMFHTYTPRILTAGSPKNHPQKEKEKRHRPKHIHFGVQHVRFAGETKACKASFFRKNNIFL